MPQENPRELPARGTTRCPWGRDCPWDWPQHVPFHTRAKWAMQAVWYALTGQHPKEPLVFQAALSKEELLRHSKDTLDEHAREILSTIEYYETELRAFRSAGRSH